MVPRKTITFLGATQSNKGVKRLDEITKRLPGIINLTNAKMREKLLQKIRGFLIYYLCYAKYFNTIINRFILNLLEAKRFILSLVNIDFIKFNKEFKQNITIFSDATPSQNGAYVNSIPFSTKVTPSNIMITETLAAILAILQAQPFSNININVDNIATLGYLIKGSAKILNSLPI